MCSITLASTPDCLALLAQPPWPAQIDDLYLEIPGRKQTDSVVFVQESEGKNRRLSYLRGLVFGPVQVLSALSVELLLRAPLPSTRRVSQCVV